jgi:hypothetical protein
LVGWRKSSLLASFELRDERHTTGVEAVNAPRHLEFPSLHGFAQDRAGCLQLCHIEDNVLLDSIVEQVAGLILRSLYCRPKSLDE